MVPPCRKGEMSIQGNCGVVMPTELIQIVEEFGFAEIFFSFGILPIIPKKKICKPKPMFGTFSSKKFARFGTHSSAVTVRM